jgi:hypothetical protein
LVRVLHIPIDHIYTDLEPEPDWLVPNLIHKGNLILLCGLAGIGKSFFSYALANALATGSHFIDGKMPLAKVLYFDDENARADLSAYARWTWRGMGAPPRDLLRANLRVESRTLSGSNDWRGTILARAEKLRPDLIIIDTATPACHISDENDNAEAAAATQAIRLAQDAAGPQCAVLVLKHLRIDANTGAADVRGAKHWKGAVDAIWYHLGSRGRPRRDGWRNTVIRPEKNRAYGLRDTLKIRPSFIPDFSVTLDIERMGRADGPEDDAETDTHDDRD